MQHNDNHHIETPAPEHKDNDDFVDDGNDPNVAAMRAGNLLFRVLTQCSQRLGFASLNPQQMPLQQGSKNGKSLPLPELFSRWASTQCAAFLSLFELERRASEARHELMRLSMKVRFREKLLDNKIVEGQLEIHERRVREQQRELYRQISGGILASRSKCIYMRTKLRSKDVPTRGSQSLEHEMAGIHQEILRLKELFAHTSKVEFKMEAQLMRLVLVSRDELRRLMRRDNDGRNNNNLEQQQQHLSAPSNGIFTVKSISHPMSPPPYAPAAAAARTAAAQSSSDHPQPPNSADSKTPSVAGGGGAAAASTCSSSSSSLQVMMDPQGRALVAPSRYEGSSQIDAKIGMMGDFPVRTQWVRHNTAAGRETSSPSPPSSSKHKHKHLGLRSEYSPTLKGNVQPVFHSKTTPK